MLGDAASAAKLSSSSSKISEGLICSTDEELSVVPGEEAEAAALDVPPHSIKGSLNKISCSLANDGDDLPKLESASFNPLSSSFFASSVNTVLESSFLDNSTMFLLSFTGSAVSVVAIVDLLLLLLDFDAMAETAFEPAMTGKATAPTATAPTAPTAKAEPFRIFFPRLVFLAVC